MSDLIMEPIRIHPNVTTLKRTHLPAAIGVLTNAFTGDPLMSTLFAVSTSPFESSLQELMRFSCEVRLLLDWPLLGYLESSQQLVGVAGLSLPGVPNWPPALIDVYAQLEGVIGAESKARLEAYAQQADSNRPQALHHQLGLIGVDPQHGGHGYGSELMHVFHQMADADPSSTGIWLDTENPRNVPWYQKHGYHVMAETRFFDLTIWGMFRPKTDS